MVQAEGFGFLLLHILNIMPLTHFLSPLNGYSHRLKVTRVLYGCASPVFLLCYTLWTEFTLCWSFGYRHIFIGTGSWKHCAVFTPMPGVATIFSSISFHTISPSIVPTVYWLLLNFVALRPSLRLWCPTTASLAPSFSPIALSLSPSEWRSINC